MENSELNYNIYYDFTKVMSYNSLWNFILGERGVGKTYGILKHCIRRFIQKGEQFVYVRRYKTELKDFKLILDPFIANEEFKDHKLEIKGMKVYVDNKIAGHGIQLSNAITKKSTPFPMVGSIVFDEFIIDKGNIHYMTNEVTAFMELYESISRLRDVRTYFLGNAISIANPYFMYFGLTIPYNSDVKTFKDNLILVNYIKNEKYREVKKNTRFGKLIEGTTYGSYAIDNKFLRDNDNFIQQKSGQCESFCNIIVNGETYGVWSKSDKKEGMLLYFSKDYDPNQQFVFTTSDKDHSELTKLLTPSGEVMKRMRFLYQISHCRFESQVIKSVFTHFLSVL